MTCASLEEYLAAVNGVFGLYYDSQRGFQLVFEEAERVRQFALHKFHKATPEKLDATTVLYSRGLPSDPRYMPLHTVTQADLRARNRQDGFNSKMLGNMCLVMIFEYWETEYRRRIADELRISKDALMVDTIGDIRLFRNSILHHSAVALPNIVNCRKFKWFSPGDIIAVSRAQMEEVVGTLVTDLRAACVA
ncbi:MAG: hypothetical protein IPG49_14555 [Proteobacteria bacterium]|nr:hypothetical protein [Pseudomonadota bacterium]